MAKPPREMLSVLLRSGDGREGSEINHGIHRNTRKRESKSTSPFRVLLCFPWLCVCDDLSCRGNTHLACTFLGPGFWRLKIRPRFCSSSARKFSSPSGRPVRSCAEGFQLLFTDGAGQQTAPVGGHLQQWSDLHQDVITPSQASRRAAPAITAWCLDQSTAHGVELQYRAAVRRWSSSMTNEAKRPCHRCPRQPSRKLIHRVYRRCASPMARRRLSTDCGTTIR